MGLRDKVALVLLTGVITQITIGYCMPSSSRKACMRRYLDSFKQTKTNPVLKSPFPTKAIKSTKNIFAKCKNAKVSKEAPSDESIYTAYNFPETEYPLDSSPRDRFYLGTNFNNNPFEISKKELCNSQSDTFNILRKEMRMKRKLNSLNNNEIYQTKAEMPSYTAFSTVPVCLKNQAAFPEVQYPTNAMETWIPHYWKSTLCNPYETKYTEFPTYDTKLCENTTIFYKPYKQQFRSKTQQFMEQIEKLKSKMRGTPQSKPFKDTKELNATNGGGSTSEDLIKPDSNTTNVTPVGMEPTVNKETEAIATITDEDKYLTNKSISTNTNKYESEGTYTETDTTTITSRKVCMKPVTTLIESENLSVPPVPLPYKDFEQYDMCSAYNSKDSHDRERSVSDKTLQSSNLSHCLNKINISPPIETKSIVDEYNSPSNCSTSDTDTVIETSSASSLNEMPSEGTISSPVNVTDKTANGPSLDNITISPKKDNSESSSNASGPLNVKLPITQDSTTNSSMPDCKPIEYVKQWPNNKVPYTSLFFVPVGSSISEIQLPIMEGNSGAPIIVILPTTGNSEKSTMSSMDTRNLASCSFIPASNNTFDKESKIPTKLETKQTNSMICDKFFNKEPTPMEYMQEIPSADTNYWESLLPDFEMLPNNSMCYATTGTVKYNNFTDTRPDKEQAETAPTDAVKDDTSESTNQPIPSLLDDSADLPNKEQDETAPINSNNNDTCEPKDTNLLETLQGPMSDPTVQYDTPEDTTLPETSLPDNSTDFVPDKGPATEPAPLDTVQNDKPASKDTNVSKISPSDSSADTGPNKEPTESDPTDTSQNDTPVSKDANVPETSQPDNSTDFGPDKGPAAEPTPLDTIQDDKPASKDTNVSETSPTNSSADTGANTESTETAPRDTSQNDTPVSKDANVPKPSQPDNSTDSGPDKGPAAEPAPLDTVQDDKYSSKGTNVSETSPTDSSANTGPNKEPTETAPRDTSQNDTPVSKDANVPETSQPDNSTDSGPDKGPAAEPAPLDAVQDDKPASKDTNVSETSPTDSSADTGPNKEPTKSAPRDTGQNDTPVSKDAHVPETSQPDNTTDSGPDKGHAAKPAPLDTVQDNKPGSKDTNVSETSPTDSSADTGPNKEPTESAPRDTSQNDTPVSKDSHVPETSQLDNSTDSGPDKGPAAEPAPLDTVQDDKPASKDTNVSETSPTDSSADTGPNKEPTESAPRDTSQNDTPVSKDVNVPETSQPDNTADSGPDKGPAAELSQVDTVQDDKPTSKDTHVSETSPSYSFADTGPNKAPTESAPRDTSQNYTPVSRDANVPETSQPDNSTHSGPDKGLAAEPAPLDAVQDDKPASKDTNVSETSPTDSSADTGPNKEPTESAPRDTSQNDTPVSKDAHVPKTSQPDNTTDFGPDKGPAAEPAPLDTVQDDKPASKDTNVSETSPTDSSADTGPNKEPTESAPRDTSQNDTPVSKDAHVPETSQPDNTTDSGPDKGPAAEPAPLDTVQDDKPVSKDTNVSETSPTDSSADTGPNKEPTESAPRDTSENDTPVSKDANVPETQLPANPLGTGPDKELAESAPLDTVQNDTPGSEDKNIPETSLPDSPSDSEPDKGLAESTLVDTILIDTPVSKGSKVSEPSIPESSPDSVLIKELSETTPTDTITNYTLVLKDTYLPEYLQPDSYPDSGPDKGLAESAPLDSTQTDTPILKDMILPQSILPFYSADFVLDKEIAQSTPTDTVTNDTPALKDLNLPHNSVSDISTDPRPNKRQAETTPNDIIDTCVHKDTNVPKTSLRGNSKHEPNKGETETVLTDSIRNETSVTKDTNLSENSLAKNSKNASSIEQVDSEGTAFKNITILLKGVGPPDTLLNGESVDSELIQNANKKSSADSLKNNTPLPKDLSDAIRSLVLNIIKNHTLLPVNKNLPLKSLTDKNVGSDLEKELSNAKVPEMFKDDKLPLTLLSDIIDDLEEGDEEKSDDIIKNNKTLLMGMELPLSLLFNNSKTSELDKRLADTEFTNTSEHNKILPKETALRKTLTDSTKSCALNIGLPNTAQNNVIIDTKKIPATSEDDDTNKAKMDNRSKKIKSKFSYKYRSHSNMYDRQKPADAMVSNIIKDDNPLRVDIDIPLSLQPENTLPDTTITRNSKTNIEVPEISSTDNMENSKQDKAVPDLLLSNVTKDKTLLPIDQMPRVTQQGYASGILHDKAIEDNPTVDKDASRNGCTPVIKEAPISIAKELTRAELKELIKYLYVSV